MRASEDAAQARFRSSSIVNLDSNLSNGQITDKQSVYSTRFHLRLRRINSRKGIRNDFISTETVTMLVRRKMERRDADS
jgi:hypothetical protein